MQCLTILDRTSDPSGSLTFVPLSVPSSNTELYVCCLFITRIPNSRTLKYHRYAIRLFLFVFLSILPYCKTTTMMFANSFDPISDHRLDQSHSPDDPNAMSIYNMLKIIPLSSLIKSYTLKRYNPWNNIIANNTDHHANWQTLSSDCKAKSVSPLPSPKPRPKPKLPKATTLSEFLSLLSSSPTLEGAISRVSHQLHFLDSVGARDPSVTKTAKYIQQTAQGLTSKIHRQFLPNDGWDRGRGSGGRGRGPYLSATKETTGRSGGLLPSDSSTTTAQASNVGGTSSGKHTPFRDSNNNNNNNINNNNNTDDKPGDDDENNKPQNR